MGVGRFLRSGAAAVGMAFMAGATAAPAVAQQAAAIAINGNDIGGVVSGPNGPEAGVWVIAETTDLATRLIKSVVTDDLGRYLIPELPAASYDIFVRGYGLADTAKVRSAPGRRLDFATSRAPSAKAAAEIYPAISSVPTLFEQSQLVVRNGLGYDDRLQRK
jgi:hypothetical protein